MKIGRVIHNLSQGDKTLYIALISVFLPYPVTAVVLVVLGLSLWINPKSRTLLVRNRINCILIGTFSLINLIVGIIFGNWFGIMAACAFLLIITLFEYSQAVMTSRLFENILSLICIMSILTTCSAIVERLIYIKLEKYRCASFYLNPNYLGCILAVSVCVCAYKVIARRGNPMFFYCVALFNGIGLYLSGSMFVWLTIFICLSLMLMLFGEHQFLSIFMIIASVLMLIISAAPDLIPRIDETVFTTENRINIWKTAIDALGDYPVFGRGFFAYYFIQPGIPGAYPTTHCHNIILDCLLNFGVVNSIILLVYLFRYYSLIIKCHDISKSKRISSFLIALSIAVIVHSMVDLTFIWIQTGTLIILIMSGIT
ncbi:MAG: O-antigen ligase family protein, partial [bacterium]|nr:O-antigen ligase family protein [bacterium]